MSDTDNTTRTVVSPSTGARIGLVVALAMLVGVGYLLWSPIQLYPAEGFPTKCGMAAAPPSDELGRAICGDIHLIRQWQAGTLAVIAAVIALGSFYVFGVNRRVEPLLGSEDGASKAETGTEEPSEPGAEEPSEPGAEESSVTGAEEPSTDSSSDESATTPTSRTQQTDSAAT